MEYAIYPFEYMNITQKYNQGNHIPHWQNAKDFLDKPWDDACKDSGRDYFAPKNDFIVEEVIGLDPSKATNSVRLKSVNKLKMPYCEDYLCLSLTHMNEDNLRQVKAGDILRAGTKILLEGTDGFTTGNHFHITANIGKYYGFKNNSNGSACFVYEKSLLPEEAFYLDSSYTKIVNANGVVFQEVPKDTVAVPESKPEPSRYPFKAILKKGTQLYGVNGYKYNTTTADREVTVLDDVGGRYKVEGKTFDTNPVYVDKSAVDGSKYPYSATIKKGTYFYDANGRVYTLPAKADRVVTVLGELNGRFKIEGKTFTNNPVYCDKNAIY